MDFVYLSQIFEWKAMIYTILAQKGKLVEEILYDISNPNVTEKREYRFSKAKRNLGRRKEKILKYLFISAFVLKGLYSVGLSTIQIVCTDLVDLPFIYGHLSMWVSCFLLLCKTVIFLELLWLMHRHIRYEFDRLYKNLCLYFVIDWISYFISIYTFTMIRLSLHEYQHVVTFIFITNLHQIGMSCAILYLKDTRDMIQELSKLDNLLVVSIFQRYKQVPVALGDSAYKSLTSS